MTTLHLKVFVQTIYDPATSTTASYLTWTTPDTFTNVPTTRDLFEVGSPQDPTATPYPLFTSIDAAIAYYGSTHGPAFITLQNGYTGATYYTTYDVEQVDPSVEARFDALATVANTGMYSDLAGKPTLSTVASTGAYSDLLGKPTLATVAITGAYTDLIGLPVIPSFTAQAHINNAATNAVDTNATNYNLVSGLLGVATGLNSANAAQNDLADKYNDLAGKFNTLLSHMVTLGLQA